MVYNRSSLSITDLTSDSEYSVTVAGRDGAGRLGQESEELSMSLNGNLYYAYWYMHMCSSKFFLCIENTTATGAAT